jgi:hypothetical protein
VLLAALNPGVLGYKRAGADVPGDGLALRFQS